MPEDFFESEDAEKSPAQKVINSFFECAAHNRRFLNGADIETIVDAAFCTLFAQSIGEILERSKEESNTPMQYDAKRIDEALKKELCCTRSYFDNNMAQTARYWLEMSQLHFRNAGKTHLLDEEAFDPETGMFNDLAFSVKDMKRETYCQEAQKLAKVRAEAGDYDEAMRYTLAAEICKQNSHKGGNRT